MPISDKPLIWDPLHHQASNQQPFSTALAAESNTSLAIIYSPIQNYPAHTQAVYDPMMRQAYGQFNPSNDMAAARYQMFQQYQAANMAMYDNPQMAYEQMAKGFHPRQPPPPLPGLYYQPRHMQSANLAKRTPELDTPNTDLDPTKRLNKAMPFKDIPQHVAAQKPQLPGTFATSGKSLSTPAQTSTPKKMPGQRSKTSTTVQNPVIMDFHRQALLMNAKGTTGSKKRQFNQAGEQCNMSMTPTKKRKPYMKKNDK